MRSDVHRSYLDEVAFPRRPAVSAMHERAAAARPIPVRIQFHRYQAARLATRDGRVRRHAQQHDRSDLEREDRRSGGRSGAREFRQEFCRIHFPPVRNDHGLGEQGSPGEGRGNGNRGGVDDTSRGSARRRGTWGLNHWATPDLSLDRFRSAAFALAIIPHNSIVATSTHFVDKRGSVCQDLQSAVPRDC